MTHVLENVLTGQIALEDFKLWLTTDSLENSVDKADFVSYFLNYVKEKCSWLTSKNGKIVESPFKQQKSSDNPLVLSVGQKLPKGKKSPKKKNESPKKQNENYTKNAGDNYFHTDVSSKYTDRIKRNGLTSSLGDWYPDSHQRNYEERNSRKSESSAKKSLNFNTGKDSKSKNNKSFAPDINSFDAFPPVGSEVSTKKPKDSKTKRRITPTPIQVAQKGSINFRNSQFAVPTEKVPDDVFKSTPFVETSSQDLQEERQMLRITRDKLLQCSPSNSFSNLKIESNFSPNKSASNIFIVPDPEKVCYKNELLIFSVIYDVLISNALVPNITSELYFIFEIITSKTLPEDKSDDVNCIFCSVHNCTFFAVSVLNNLKNVLYLLDNSTLSSLSEIPYLSKFSLCLTNFLQEHCNMREEIVMKSQLINRVPFYLEEDSRENFIDDHAFSSFRKQRDLFYELLRDWQDQPLGQIDTNFREKFSRKAKSLISLGPNAINMHHLAKLFQNQLIASCLGLEMNEVCNDLLSDIQRNFPGKIEKLRQRFMMPFCVGGPNPPPTFYGTQAFFCELIDAIACASFNQQLQDIFVSKILDFNSADIFSDAELSPLDSVKEKYIFLLHTLRLLGKFLGYLYFLPYKVTASLSLNIQNCQLMARKQSVPPIDILKLLREAVEKNRIVLTVPWIIEYLSMVDPVGKKLPFIEDSLRILEGIYRSKYFSSTESMSFWFLRLIIGWLFDILCYSPKYCSFNQPISFETSSEHKGIDLLAIIDKQLVHSCCPYLVEFKVLVYNFLNDIKNDKKREVRKITPLSTTSKPLSVSLAKQQIQNQLEENFFFVHPPSMKKTVEFVAERIASKIISKIRSEVTDFKFQTVDDIVKQKTNKASSDCKPDIEIKLQSYVDSFILNQYNKFHQNIIDFVNITCRKDIDTVLLYLFSDDIKQPVLKICCEISIRIALDKILNWCDANLILEDITSDIKMKLRHLSKEDGDGSADSVYELSHLIIELRQCIMDVISDSSRLKNDFMPMLSEVSCIMGKQIGSTSKKLIVFLTVDLYIALLIHNSEKCSEEFMKSLISIWSLCPNNYDLEQYFLGPQNIKLLLGGKNFEISCEKFLATLSKLISCNVFSANKLKSCVKDLMLCEWKDLRTKNLFDHIANILATFSSKVA